MTLLSDERFGIARLDHRDCGIPRLAGSSQARAIAWTRCTGLNRGGRPERGASLSRPSGGVAATPLAHGLLAHAHVTGNTSVAGPVGEPPTRSAPVTASAPARSVGSVAAAQRARQRSTRRGTGWLTAPACSAKPAGPVHGNTPQGKARSVWCPSPHPSRPRPAYGNAGPCPLILDP